MKPEELFDLADQIQEAHPAIRLWRPGFFIWKNTGSS